MPHVYTISPVWDLPVQYFCKPYVFLIFGRSHKSAQLFRPLALCSPSKCHMGFNNKLSFLLHVRVFYIQEGRRVLVLKDIASVCGATNKKNEPGQNLE